MPEATTTPTFTCARAADALDNKAAKHAPFLHHVLDLVRNDPGVQRCCPRRLHCQRRHRQHGLLADLGSCGSWRQASLGEN